MCVCDLLKHAQHPVIGRWLAKRGRRDDVVIVTKVGMWDRHPGLGANNIRAAAEDSLRRLGIAYIDLYYAHRDDESTPLKETLGAFDALVRAGKVRYVGASNYSAPRLRQALQISQREGLASYVALQTHYNLMERDYESQLAGVAAEHKLAVLAYFALAMGFLTGKYRAGTRVDSARAQRASAYLDERGERPWHSSCTFVEPKGARRAAIVTRSVMAGSGTFTLATPFIAEDSPPDSSEDHTCPEPTAAPSAGKPTKCRT
jgi:aryl-alcohol dehydrogenase-like predicted oxidoreductase